MNAVGVKDIENGYVETNKKGPLMLKKTVESFSDEDLKRLKEYFCKRDGCICDQLQALLDRLEAAERIVEGYDENIDLGAWADLYKVWRKAAGKEGR